MFCEKCGKEISNDARFCPFCGVSVEGDVTGNSKNDFFVSKRKREKVKRPFYKKKRFWITTVFVLYMIWGFNAFENGEIVDETIDMSEQDMEDFIGKKENKIKSLGFEKDEDKYSLGYGMEDGAVQVECVDGKVEKILIEESEDTPCFHGVKVGMDVEAAYEKLIKAYPEDIEKQSGEDYEKMLVNYETKGAVDFQAKDGKVRKIFYQTLDDETIEALKQEKELRAEYIFPDSNSAYLSEDEVRRKEVAQLNIGRNEIFARHGYIFKNKELKQYFGSTSWYQGTIKGEQFNADEEFNDFEKKNVELIKKIEDEINGVEDEFIGLEGVYICTSATEDLTGRIDISDVDEDGFTFKIIILEEMYELMTEHAQIINNNTAQMTAYGITLTFHWTDAENMTVSRSGEITSGTDAGPLSEVTDDQTYTRPSEFNH